MRVIATAGHVDHGKSTLVEALTGTHPDRLKEEQDREMTIDLGFGYFSLPDGTSVGVVDVPGHRDFIENMLAGVGGVDAALLVIAADEGPMPQTREHLAILDLLGVRAGVVALTKTDLVENPAQLAAVRAEIERLLQPTTLAAAEIVPVSARTKMGLAELQAALERCLAGTPARTDLGRPRLPIDRVFTLTGFGSVVTGTLLDGVMQTGDEVEILPGGKRARIRGIQSRNQKIARAEPGMRSALNLSGVEVADLHRGQIAAHPDTYKPTKLLDARIRVLPDSPGAIRHNAEVKLFLGTAEVMARIRVLGADSIAPGAEGWIQAVLGEEIVAVCGDRVILRRPSPGATLGGGEVADPHPAGLHRRLKPAVISSLETLRSGDPADLILQALDGLGVVSAEDLLRKTVMDPDRARSFLHALADRGEIAIISGDPSTPGALFSSRKDWDRLKTQMRTLLEGYQRTHPLRGAMPREELRVRLGLSGKVAGPVLARAAMEGAVEETARGIRLPGYAPHFSPAQEQAVRGLLARFEQDPYNPPSVKECAALGADVYAALIEQGLLKPVSEEVVFLQATLEEMTVRIIDVLRQKGTLTVAETRDLFGSSRKYILALLGSLDAQGITRREGDVRKLR